MCIGEPEHLHRMRWRIVWTREKHCSTSRHGSGASYRTSHPGISARAIAFGRSWPFAAFCYRPCFPVRHWGRDMSAPKPYVTNPTPTHSSRPPLSLQFSVRFRWLIYSREKSFYLSYGRHGVTYYKVYAHALLKVTYIHAQTLFHVEFQNNYKSLYLGDIRFTAKIHSIYRYMIKCIIFTDIY